MQKRRQRKEAQERSYKRELQAQERRCRKNMQERRRQKVVSGKEERKGGADHNISSCPVLLWILCYRKS
jgi:transcription elongation GreA/GreB family factor